MTFSDGQETTSTVPPHTCGGCNNRWAGSRTCHCAAPQCHRTFSSPTSFDAHRIRRGAREGQCADPATAGLVLMQRAGYQVWGHPADEEAAERFRANRAAAKETSDA